MEITYKRPYPNSRVSGHGHYDGIECLYFGDVSTYDCIDVFSIDGNLLWHVPLDTVTALEHIADIAIAAKDSIWVLSEYTSQLFLIDFAGKCRKRIDLSTYFKNLPSGHYEIESSIYDDFLADDGFLFSVRRATHLDSTEFTGAKDSQERFKRDYETPYFLHIKHPFSPNESVNFFDEKIYYEFLHGDTAMVVEGRSYTKNTGDIFVFSNYSDSIIVFDKDSGNIKRHVAIQSAYTHIGVLPVKATEENLAQFQTLNNKNARTQGCVRSIYYDDYNKVYHVIVLHDVRGRPHMRPYTDLGHGLFTILILNYSASK